MQKFRDIHKNKLGFLIGSGFSLKDVEPKKLYPYVTMAVGQSIFKVKKPTYFFSSDGWAVLHRLVETAYKSKKTKIIVSPELAVQGYEDRTFTFGMKRGNVDYRNTILKDDNLLIQGMLSTHPALHLMYIMGCRPIVLVGVDGKVSSDGHRGFWSLPEYYENVHPKTKEFYGEDPRATFNNIHPDGLNILHHGGNECWERIARLQPDLFVINSSMDSIVPSFPKMELDEVIKLYGDKKNE